jgi:hypothetical protein
MAILENLLATIRLLGVRIRNPSVGAVAAVGGAVGLGWLSSAAPLAKIAETSIFSAGELSVILAFAGLIVCPFLWWFATRAPRKKSHDAFGIALALRYERAEEAARLKSDFIESLRQNLRISALAFEIVEIPSYLAPDVADDGTAKELLSESQCHLIIWGSLRTRMAKKDKEVYVLTLEGAVTHSVTDAAQTRNLTRDMRLALPKSQEFSVATELTSFEIAAENLGLSSRFILGIAAIISSNGKAAAMLFEEVMNDADRKIKTKKRGRRGKNRTMERLLSRTKEIYPALLIAVVRDELFLWFRNKRNSHLDTADACLEKYRKLKGDSPSYLIPKALVSFVKNCDASRALKIVMKCKIKSLPDPTWRYSAAFLYAVSGNTNAAMTMYDAAFCAPLQVDPQNVTYIEEFIEWWLNENNGPPVLSFMLARLNAEIKKDFVSAAADLRRYEQTQDQPDPALAAYVTKLKAALDSR